MTMLKPVRFDQGNFVFECPGCKAEAKGEYHREFLLFKHNFLRGSCPNFFDHFQADLENCNLVKIRRLLPESCYYCDHMDTKTCEVHNLSIQEIYRRVRDKIHPAPLPCSLEVTCDCFIPNPLYQRIQRTFGEEEKKMISLGQKPEKEKKPVSQDPENNITKIPETFGRNYDRGEISISKERFEELFKERGMISKIRAYLKKRGDLSALRFIEGLEKKEDEYEKELFGH